jgi:predicted nuclease of predicted toxin-antitoxin system
VRFKTDENLPNEADELLRQAGFESDMVHDEGLNGCSDKVLATRLRLEARVLVTLDLDFANI